MNNSNDNSGGWNDSILRKTLNITTYNSLSIKSNIKKVKKDYIPTYDVASIQKTEDYLWLLSCGEIWDNGYKANYRGYAITTEGKQYKYYKTNLGSMVYNTSNQVRAVQNGGGFVHPHFGDSSHFCCAGTAGISTFTYAGESGGVAPGFSI